MGPGNTWSSAPSSKNDVFHKSAVRLSYENRLVAVFSLAGGIAGLDALAIFFLIPFVARDLHLDNTKIGILSLAVLVGWSVSSLTAAILSDRLGRRKPFLVGAFLLFAAFSAMSAIAHSFATLFASRLLMGLAEGPVIPIQQAIVMVQSSPHRRGLNMGIVQTVGAQLIGSLLGPLVMVQLAIAAGWRAAFLIAGVPGLIMAFLIARVVHEPHKPEGSAAFPSAAVPLLRLLGYRNVQVCSVVAAAAAGWFYLLLTFLPIWTVQVLGFSASVMSVIMGAVGIGAALFSVIMPWYSDKFGRRRAMLITIAMGTIAPAAVLIVGPHPVVLALCVFTGCAMVSIFSLCTTVTIEAVPRGGTATATAVVIAIATLVGGGAGPLIGGVLADRFGLAAAFWMALLLVAIAFAACFAIKVPTSIAIEVADLAAVPATAGGARH
jgi:MFS family permease